MFLPEVYFTFLIFLPHVFTQPALNSVMNRILYIPGEVLGKILAASKLKKLMFFVFLFLAAPHGL